MGPAEFTKPGLCLNARQGKETNGKNGKVLNGSASAVSCVARFE